MTYFGNSNQMLSFVLPASHLSSTMALGLHLFKRPQICKMLKNPVLLLHFAECLRFCALSSARVSVEDSSLEAKASVMFSGGRLASRVLNRVKKKPKPSCVPGIVMLSSSLPD